MLVILIAFTDMKYAVADNVKSKSSRELTIEQKEELSMLTERLNVIQGMDYSKMTRLEKKQLKLEVREIKKKITDLGGGVYISAGALIVILILLIILT